MEPLSGYGPKEVLGRLFEPTHPIMEGMAYGRWVDVLEGKPPIYSVSSQGRPDHPDFPADMKVWVMMPTQPAISILKLWIEFSFGSEDAAATANEAATVLGLGSFRLPPSFNLENAEIAVRELEWGMREK